MCRKSELRPPGLRYFSNLLAWCLNNQLNLIQRVTSLWEGPSGPTLLSLGICRGWFSTAEWLVSPSHNGTEVCTIGWTPIAELFGVVAQVASRKAHKTFNSFSRHHIISAVSDSHSVPFQGQGRGQRRAATNFAAPPAAKNETVCRTPATGHKKAPANRG
jgi:hypothetical protein